jgi:hypothetical protein
MIKIADSVSTSVIDEELVLLDGETGKYFGLNPVASRMFRLLAETGDEERSAAALLAEYEVSEQRIRSDIAAFVALLIEKGFAERHAN